MQRNILYEESAIKEVLTELKKNGYQWQNIILINKNRYAIVIGKSNPNIAILLKGDVFFNFGEKFKHLGETGVGDSINVKALKQFLQYDVKTIYTMFRDGKIYCIDFQEFLLNSHKWVQKEGTEVRSISIHHYKRVNKEESTCQKKQ